jgi:serine/threonine-protein kinase
MNTTQPMDRQTFLSNLRQSNLVTAAQMSRVAPRLSAAADGQALARALIGEGLLTRFQAELLLANRVQGFFLGQYKILDQLGRGGMGRVFRAEHQTMNRIVAIKVLAAHLVKTPRAQQMFQREVRAAARLVHPNIVTAFDANQIGERCYLVMEYVDGANLEELVRQRGPLPVGYACDFMRQAALALQHAHEIGMVHRDVKPANLLVQRPHSTSASGYCMVKILDFGLARLASLDGSGAPGRDSILAVENTVMGTPDYLSPEQARNLHDVDIRSDLYSLGCTFYYLLTGKVPFPGGTTLEKLVRHSTVEAPPVELARPDVPPQVAAIVRRLMAKEPEYRFQTPADLAAALAPFAVQSASTVAASAVAVGVNAAVTQIEGATWNALPSRTDDDSSLDLDAVPLNLSAGPLSFAAMSSVRLKKAVVADQQRNLWYAVGAAVAIVAAALGGVGYLLARY